MQHRHFLFALIYSINSALRLALWRHMSSLERREGTTLKSWHDDSSAANDGEVFMCSVIGIAVLWPLITHNGQQPIWVLRGLARIDQLCIIAGPVVQSSQFWPLLSIMFAGWTRMQTQLNCWGVCVCASVHTCAYICVHVCVYVCKRVMASKMSRTVKTVRKALHYASLRLCLHSVL